MKSTMNLQLDTTLLLRLISQLQIRGGTQDLSETISSAIELWLREQANLRKGCDPACMRGYQWKTLFLPEGTEIRSWSYGENNYARVVGDEIIHNGKPVTPNQFAQSRKRHRQRGRAPPHRAKAGTCPSAANIASALKTSLLIEAKKNPARGRILK